MNDDIDFVEDMIQQFKDKIHDDQLDLQMWEKKLIELKKEV